MKIHAKKVHVLNTDQSVILDSEEDVLQYLIDNNIRSSKTYFEEKIIKVVDTSYADYDNWKSK